MSIQIHHTNTPQQQATFNQLQLKTLLQMCCNSFVVVFFPAPLWSWMKDKVNKTGTEVYSLVRTIIMPSLKEIDSYMSDRHKMLQFFVQSVKLVEIIFSLSELRSLAVKPIFFQHNIKNHPDQLRSCDKMISTVFTFCWPCYQQAGSRSLTVSKMTAGNHAYKHDELKLKVYFFEKVLSHQLDGQTDNYLATLMDEWKTITTD